MTQQLLNCKESSSISFVCPFQSLFTLLLLENNLRKEHGETVSEYGMLSRSRMMQKPKTRPFRTGKKQQTIKLSSDSGRHWRRLSSFQLIKLFCWTTFLREGDRIWVWTSKGQQIWKIQRKQIHKLIVSSRCYSTKERKATASTLRVQKKGAQSEHAATGVLSGHKERKTEKMGERERDPKIQE